MDMGWVVATLPAAMLVGIRPVGCGGLMVGKVAPAGGFWTLGGTGGAPGGVFPAGGSVGFSFFLPKENKAID
jgi:hypothetical protein